VRQLTHLDGVMIIRGFSQPGLHRGCQGEMQCSRISEIRALKVQPIVTRRAETPWFDSLHESEDDTL